MIFTLTEKFNGRNVLFVNKIVEIKKPFRNVRFCFGRYLLWLQSKGKNLGIDREMAGKFTVFCQVPVTVIYYKCFMTAL